PQNLVDYYTEKSGMLNIQTQRGCAFKCCYCTYPLIEGTAFRRRGPRVVCDEIEDVIASGTRYFFIVVSVFNTSREHVTGICEEILKRKLDIKWGCYLRPQGITQPQMDLMARAGLTHIEFGTDSFSDSVLDAYGKQFTVDDVIHASECARNAKVRYAHFLIIGGPGETEETIREGFSNAGRIKKSVFFPYVGMRLYPGTPLHEIALKEGVVTREKDLFEPCFYITPHIPKDTIARMLKEHGGEQKNWIIGEVGPELRQVMDNLRKMGVVGPLWEFLIR
ncbi:MAG: radical SAM protein, partial [Deltaproteobacteria bacterium]|nr:radical SAM protein [Deltaproteobacteria bacterium]